MKTRSNRNASGGSAAACASAAVQERPKNRLFSLVRILLLSSGGRNIIKYEKDPKKRRRVIGGYVGEIILYVMVAAFSVSVCIGLGLTGNIGAAPGLCTIAVSAVELLFGILRAGDYLFSKKDYEILMAMPFTPREVVSGRFAAMYIRNLPFTLVCSLSMMVTYGYFVHPPVYTYVIWVVLTFFLPLIPTVAAAAISVAGTAAGAGVKKHKTIIQSVLIFAFMIFFIFFGQIMGRFFSGEAAVNALNAVSGITDSVGGYYLPVRWFSDAVNKTNPLAILLLAGISVLLAWLVFTLISQFYRSINTRMQSVSENKKYKMGRMRSRSPVRAIMFKEWKRLTGSSVYLTNMCFGLIFILILSVVILFIDPAWLISFIFRNAPIRTVHFIPVIPQALYFFIGMAPVSAAALSLEGKNIWILKSLPVTNEDILRGKMRFSFLLQAVVMVIGCVLFGISFRAGLVNILLFIVCGLALCAFSTAFGMRCNVRHVNYDWDREIEVVKQGSSLTLYMLPHVFITMGICAASVFIGHMIGAAPVLLVIAGIYALFAFLSYRSVMKSADMI